MTLESSPIRSYGLTHAALAVRDPARAFDFYRRVFGMVAAYRQRNFIQAQTRGTRDVPAFERGAKSTGRSAGIAHPGFRLTDPLDIDAAVAAIRAAGGTVAEQGEFVPANPTRSSAISTAPSWRAGWRFRRRSIHHRQLLHIGALRIAAGKTMLRS